MLCINVYTLRSIGVSSLLIVLYVNDILLVINDVGLFNETKQILSKTFWMKDLGETSFFFSMEIYREIS